tara:strand:+ start:97670 stop:99148 length:1479 start_codon:yes stop_codon:yes gene_type:complete
MLPLIVTFVIYIGIVFLIGFLASRRTKNLSDYILGGRHLPGPIVALGAGASDMSTWLLLALPGLIFVGGINGIWVPVGLAIGAYLNWQFVAKRLRVFTQVNKDSLTLPAYFDNRFRDRTRILRMVTALVILIFFTFYVAAGFVAAALLMQLLFGIHYMLALLIGAGVIIIYVFIGGFLAVSWIDFFQGCLMFIALVIVPVVAITHMGGVHATMSHLTTLPHHYFDVFSGTSAILIFSYLAWGLGYSGQPHIVVRFMAARSSREIPIAQLICMAWMIFALYLAVMTGFAGKAYFMPNMLAHPETVLIELTKSLLNPWLGGVVIAGALSAAMSATSAQLLASASAAAEDFYHMIRGPRTSPSQLMWVARLAVLVIGVIAVYLAHSPKSTIYALVAYAWAGLGASFGPIVILSLYWRRMTGNAAIAGMITAALVVIGWSILGKYEGGIFTLFSIIPGFFANLAIIIIVSLASAPPSEQVTRRFDFALKVYKRNRY